MRVIKNVLKRVGVFTLAVALVAGITPIYHAPMSKADGELPDVKYLDDQGAEKTCTSYNTVQTSSEVVTWNSGWYVVQNDVTLDQRVQVSGDVKLILADGAMLTAKKGIAVPSGRKLTIYGQAEGTGLLLAGHDGTNCTISDNNAGIGGSDSGVTSCGEITIIGGKVKAYGSSNYGSAGIGGSGGNASGTVTIKGGIVEAYGGTSSSGGAGIGGGYSRDGGTVNIDGGNVMATGGNMAAGIGGGSRGESGNITITGGEIKGIGGGDSTTGAGIGSGGLGNGGTITINGGVIEAESDDYGISLGNRGTVSIMGGYVKAHGTALGIQRSEESYSVQYGSNVSYYGAENNYPTINESNKNQFNNYMISVETIHYDEKSKDGNAVTTSTRTCSDYTPVTSSTNTVTWNGGWYVVNTNVTITKSITVSDTVNLILCDGATLTAKKGIIVNNNTLNIYAQSVGTGTLIATGSGGAGIGNTIINNYCNVNIHGGIVTATGTGNYAGIRGGSGSGMVGTITIYDGTVTATGGNTAAGIGGNKTEAGCNVKIYGGTVNATGGSSAAGIGGGSGGSNNGSLTIGTGMHLYGNDSGMPKYITDDHRAGACDNYDGTRYRYMAVDNVAPKSVPTITASNVIATYGDTDKAVSATTNGDGAISYAVRDGSGGYIEVNESTGALTIKAVPADGKAYVTVTAAETDRYVEVTKDVTVSIIALGELQPAVSYIDESGKTQTRTYYTPLTQEYINGINSYEYTVGSYSVNQKDLPGGWYVVSETVTVDERINTVGPVWLILKDGCQLNLDGGLLISDDSEAFTVYGQEGQTGKLVSEPCIAHAPVTVNGGDLVFSKTVCGNGVSFDSTCTLTVNAGKFKAVHFNDPTVEGGGVLTKYKEIIFNGGQIEISSIGVVDSMGQRGDVILGWRSANDSIKIGDSGRSRWGIEMGEKYSSNEKASVKVADGKVLADDTNAFSGTLNSSQLETLTGKTLRPAFAVNIADSFTHGTVEASCGKVGDIAYGAVGSMVTLTATPDAGYKLDTLTVRTASGQTVTTSGTGSTRTFTMPAEAVTVTSATFKAIPATAPTISGVTGAELTYGYTSGSVDVTASAATDTNYTLTYQWYSNTTNRNTGGTMISGATSASYTIPTGKRAGTTEYYYCVVTATRDDNGLSKTATSGVATVSVIKAASSGTAPTAKTLTYDGGAQGLVNAGTATGGTMYYALGTDNVTAPTIGWGTSIPTGTDVGTYYVWYKVVGDENHNDTVAACVDVNISKATWTATTATGSARYGTTGIVDLSALIALGGDASCGDVTDTDGVLDGTPSLTDKKLSFAFKDNPENKDKSATVVVHVTNATNYIDYDLTVTLTVKDKTVPTISISPITKTYDGKAITNADINGTAKVGDEVIPGVWSFSGTQSFTNASDSGVKTVVFTPNDSENIEAAESTMSLTINKATVTITAVNKNIYVGGVVPSLVAPIRGTDYTITGLVGTDALAGTPTLTYSSEPDNTNAGTYSIIPGGASVPVGGNYEGEITYRSGTLTIQANNSGGGSGTGGNGGYGGGSGGGSGGGGSNPSASPSPSASPGASPAPSTPPTPTAEPPVTTTVTNPDGSTTTTTTETDAEGTRIIESETVKPDGTVEKTNEIVKVDGSTEKTTEVINPDGSSKKTTNIENADGSSEKTTETITANGASEKVSDIVKVDGTTIHAEIQTTAKGKETSRIVETAPSGNTIVTEQVKQPSGDYSKVAVETVLKKNEDGKITGATVTINTEKKTGKVTVSASFVVINIGKSVKTSLKSLMKMAASSKKAVALTKATTTKKNGTITIEKTVKADGKTYTVTTLKKGLLKKNKTKPKKVTIKASGITKVEKGAFNGLAKKATIKIKANKKDFKRIKKLLTKSGLPKGVKIKRI